LTRESGIESSRFFFARAPISRRYFLASDEHDWRIALDRSERSVRYP
jgi:hypothetical protein